MFKKLIAIILCVSFTCQQAGLAQAAGPVDMAGFISGLAGGSAAKFRPLHLRYLAYDDATDNIKLLLDKGDTTETTVQAETGTRKLMEYFYTGLALPDATFWVNLRPDAPLDIIDRSLEKTDMGRVMLEADLQLKKDTARFTSPRTREGREYWDRVYKKAEELYGSTLTNIPTLTRPWIVPGEIIVREAPGSAYIYKATLNVMLEQDYLKGSLTYNFSDERQRQLNEYASGLVRELIIPKITREINSSKRYAALRQVYYSLILATWFKHTYGGKPGAYAGRIESGDVSKLASKTPWLKSTYFEAYRTSFNEGEYNVRETISTSFGQTVRNYVSGGIECKAMWSAIQAGMIRGGQMGSAPERWTQFQEFSKTYLSATAATDGEVIIAQKDGGFTSLPKEAKREAGGIKAQFDSWLKAGRQPMAYAYHGTSLYALLGTAKAKENGAGGYRLLSRNKAEEKKIPILSGEGSSWGGNIGKKYVSVTLLYTIARGYAEQFSSGFSRGVVDLAAVRAKKEETLNDRKRLNFNADSPGDKMFQAALEDLEYRENVLSGMKAEELTEAQRLLEIPIVIGTSRDSFSRKKAGQMESVQEMNIEDYIDLKEVTHVYVAAEHVREVQRFLDNAGFKGVFVIPFETMDALFLSESPEIGALAKRFLDGVGYSRVMKEYMTEFHFDAGNWAGSFSFLAEPLKKIAAAVREREIVSAPSAAPSARPGVVTEDLSGGKTAAFKYAPGHPITVRLAPSDTGLDGAVLQVIRYEDIPDTNPLKKQLNHRIEFFIIQPGLAESFKALRSGEAVELGRGEKAGRFELRPQAISRDHVRITCYGNTIEITDLKSHNGTRVEYTPAPQGGAQRDGGQAALAEFNFKNKSRAVIAMRDAQGNPANLVMEMDPLRAERLHKPAGRLFIQAGDTVEEYSFVIDKIIDELGIVQDPQGAANIFVRPAGVRPGTEIVDENMLAVLKNRGFALDSGRPAVFNVRGEEIRAQSAREPAQRTVVDEEQFAAVLEALPSQELKDNLLALKTAYDAGEIEKALTLFVRLLDDDFVQGHGVRARIERLLPVFRTHANIMLLGGNNLAEDKDGNLMLIVGLPQAGKSTMSAEIAQAMPDARFAGDDSLFLAMVPGKGVFAAARSSLFLKVRHRNKEGVVVEADVPALKQPEFHEIKEIVYIAPRARQDTRIQNAGEEQARQNLEEWQDIDRHHTAQLPETIMAALAGLPMIKVEEPQDSSLRDYPAMAREVMDKVSAASAKSTGETARRDGGIIHHTTYRGGVIHFFAASGIELAQARVIRRGEQYALQNIVYMTLSTEAGDRYMGEKYLQIIDEALRLALHARDVNNNPDLDGQGDREQANADAVPAIIRNAVVSEALKSTLILVKSTNRHYMVSGYSSGTVKLPRAEDEIPGIEQSLKQYLEGLENSRQAALGFLNDQFREYRRQKEPQKTLNFFLDGGTADMAIPDGIKMTLYKNKIQQVYLVSGGRAEKVFSWQEFDRTVKAGDKGAPSIFEPSISEAQVLAWAGRAAKGRITECRLLETNNLRPGREAPNRYFPVSTDGQMVIIGPAVAIADEAQTGARLREAALRLDGVIDQALREARGHDALADGGMLLDKELVDKKVAEAIARWEELRENLEKFQAPEDVKTQIDTAAKAGEAAKARLDGWFNDPAAESFDIEEWLRGLVNEQNGFAQSYGVEVSIGGIESGAALEPTASARVILDDAMRNLLVNAIKYRDQNKASRIVAIRVTKNGDQVRFAVTDNGLGIPESDQGRVFDGATGADERMSGVGYSSRFGLNAVKKNLGLIPGAGITLEKSAEGEGSTFNIIVPAKAVTTRPLTSMERLASLRHDVANSLGGVTLIEMALEKLRQGNYDRRALDELERIITQHDAIIALLQPPAVDQAEKDNGQADGGTPVLTREVGIFINTESVTPETAKSERVKFLAMLKTFLATDLAFTEKYSTYVADFDDKLQLVYDYDLNELLQELACNEYDGYASYFDAGFRQAKGLQKPAGKKTGIIKLTITRGKKYGMDAYKIVCTGNGADSFGADTAQKREAGKQGLNLYFGGRGIGQKVILGPTAVSDKGLLAFLWEKAGLKAKFDQTEVYQYENKYKDNPEGSGTTVTVWIPASMIKETKAGGKKDGGVTPQGTTEKRGGIDFRALPVTTQKIASSALAGVSGKAVAALDLDREWGRIEKMVNGGLAPSAQRMAEFVVACKVKGASGMYAEPLIACIAGMMRIEEEKAEPTEATLRDLLILLEADAASAQNDTVRA